MKFEIYGNLSLNFKFRRRFCFVTDPSSGTIETRAPLIVLETRTRVRSPDTGFLGVR